MKHHKFKTSFYTTLYLRTYVYERPSAFTNNRLHEPAIRGAGGEHRCEENPAEERAEGEEGEGKDGKEGKEEKGQDLPRW